MCTDGQYLSANGIGFLEQCNAIFNGTVAGSTKFVNLTVCATSCTAIDSCDAAYSIDETCYQISAISGSYAVNNTLKGLPGAMGVRKAAIPLPKPIDGAIPSSLTAAPTTTSMPLPTSSNNAAPTSSTSHSQTTSAGKPTQASASTAASASATPRVSSQNNDGLTSGAIAGIAIGAAVGAALLAILLTLLLCRRRRRPDRATGMFNEKSDFAHPWEAFLPQSADDKKMSNAIKALYSQIDVHVENYYGAKVHSSDDQHSLMGHFGGVDSGKLPESLEALMGENSRPLPLIKHTFAWFILGKLSPAANSEQTLLPLEFGRLPPKSTDTKSRTGEEKATSEAYDYWRVLTSYVMHPSQTSASNNLSAILSTSAHLSTAFAPWSKNERGAQEHLESVLKAASETGLLIMSQPSRFTFAWDVLRPSEQGSVVVYPAFQKTSDEHGRGLSGNQVLVEPTIEKI